MGVRCDIVFILDQALVHLLQSYFYGNLTPFFVDAFRCIVQPWVRPSPIRVLSGDLVALELTLEHTQRHKHMNETNRQNGGTFEKKW